jgi:hypothetical protein
MIIIDCWPNIEDVEEEGFENSQGISTILGLEKV